MNAKSVKNILFGAAAALSIVAVGFTSCGGKAAQSQGRPETPQNQADSVTSQPPAPAGSLTATSEHDERGPTAEAQAPATTAGGGTEKQESETCEEAALKPDSLFRDFGIGKAFNENFALQTALLDARSKMQHQLKLLTTFAVKRLYTKKGGSADTQIVINTSVFEKIATSARLICRDVYADADGDYKVYAAIELSDDALAKIHKEISKNIEAAAGISEEEYVNEMKKMRLIFLAVDGKDLSEKAKKLRQRLLEER
jgi:hypothetical protein